MAAPDYRPAFKIPYNNVRGLAALLQGYNQGAQQRFSNQNVDRSAPISPNERERTGLVEKARVQALMSMMNPTGGLGITPFPGTASAAAPVAAPATPVAPAPAVNPSNISPAAAGPVPIQQPDALKEKVSMLIEELYQARLAQGSGV